MLLYRHYIFSLLSIIGILLLFGLNSTICSLIGIDLGNESTKVAIIRPGRGIEIILNTHSQRKTPTAVSFVSSSPSIVRLFGEDALGSMVRNPSKTILHIPSFLGICSEDLVKKSKDFNCNDCLPNHLRRDLFPYEMEENKSQNGVSFKIDGHYIIPEELTAHYLDFIRRMTENLVNKDIYRKSVDYNPGPLFGSETVGAVIAIPPTFNQRQRQSLVDASEIAGLNLFGFVNSLGAAAVHQSTDLKNDKISTFLYYDMGFKYSSSCVVDFLPMNITHMGRSISTHKINVLGCSTDYNTGGHLADVAITDAIMNRIRNSPEKSPLSGIPLDNSRVIQKIAKQSIRTKLLLSTLKQADFFVESLYKDIDVSQSITRNEFDTLIKETLLSKALKPIEESLKLANKTMQDITDIEILGGGIRIPKIRTIIDNYFASFGKNVSQRLNGDEAMALGAAFVAANQSATFKTKNIFYNEISSNNYSVLIDSQEISFINNTSHFHGIHHIEIKSNEDFVAILSENSRPISRFNITGITEYISKSEDNQPLNVTLQMKVNSYGIVNMESVYGWKLANQTIRIPTMVPVNSTNIERESTNSTTNSTDDTNKKINNTKIIYEEKIILKPTPFMLKFTEEYLDCPLPLSRENKQSISHHISELNKLDAKHRQLMDSKNTLEALIYDNRNKLYDSVYMKVTLESERVEITKLLSETEDWLYEVGDNIQLEVIEDNIAKIVNKTEPMHIKAEEFKYRDELIENADKKLNFTLEMFNSIQFTHTWVHNNTFSEVRSILEDFQKWYNETKIKQSELKITDLPVLVRSEVLKKLDFIVKSVQRVRNIPKPRPKIKPRSKKNGTETSNSTRSNTTEQYMNNNINSTIFNETDVDSQIGGTEKVPNVEPNTRDQSEL